MSIRIALDKPPEFFTNLDIIRGKIVLGLNRHEQVGAILVKLEGESKTALTLPSGITAEGQTQSGPGGNLVNENHKILYKVQQVFPLEDTPPLAAPAIMAPGQHEFPFRFKVPFNNICYDPDAIAKISGTVGAGGYGAGPSLFGIGGVRVNDGSRQLFYKHVKKTLPPSFTGFPREAEIRYYIKVTIQRPGLFKENWRYQIGFKFLPIEPPRPAITNQEAYARRPFTFRPRSPAADSKRRPSRTNTSRASIGSSGSFNPYVQDGDGKLQPRGSEDGQQENRPPSIEMSARLPHPSILTCNKPIPLRLVAKKLVPSREQVFLVAFQIDLVGTTLVRCQDMSNTETTRWVVVGRHSLSIPVSAPGDPVGHEMLVPDTIWRDAALPNTVMPSFVTCNLSRTYQLEMKIGLSWGLPKAQGSSGGGIFSNPFGGGRKGSSAGLDPSNIPQTIHLPLHFSSVEVYSGLTPPVGLVDALRRQQMQQNKGQKNRPGQPGGAPPTLPPRQTQQQEQLPGPPRHEQDQEPPDPLYPPPLRPGEVAAPPYEDAPPSYDEAMAEDMTGPVFPDEERPGYSGMTDENAPSLLPEKR